MTIPEAGVVSISTRPIGSEAWTLSHSSHSSGVAAGIDCDSGSTVSSDWRPQLADNLGRRRIRVLPTSTPAWRARSTAARLPRRIPAAAVQAARGRGHLHSNHGIVGVPRFVGDSGWCPPRLVPLPCSAEWIPSRPVRLALASLVVLMPVLGIENTANITNVIWLFAAVAPWALVSLSERPRDVVGTQLRWFFRCHIDQPMLPFLSPGDGICLDTQNQSGHDCGSCLLSRTWRSRVRLCCIPKMLVSYIPQSFLDVQRTRSRDH